VKPGARADVRLDALPGRSFPASVGRVSGALEPGTRTMRVELDAPNTEGDIRPGMYAAVVLDLERRVQTLSVPAKAVLMEQGRPVVFIHSEGRARRISVEIGMDDGVRTEVTSGLTGGESVILPGREALVDGMRVEAEDAGQGGQKP
jgi:RND family efflux transporter MFP subunit